MNSHFDSLVKKLEETIRTHEGDGVNEARCLIETEIIGYLLGLKEAKKQADFVPEGIDQHHTLPLRHLNRVATLAYLKSKKS